MNVNYLAGKILRYPLNQALRLPGAWRMPVPRGYSMPYDLTKFRNGRCPECVLDIGANVGQTSLHFRKFFPKATILAFEPIEATYRKLAANVAAHKTIVPVQCALGAKDGSVEVVLRADSELNSLVTAADASQPRETVKVRTVDGIVEERGLTRVGLLKTDAQGYDLEVLQGAERSLRAGVVEAVYVEVNFDKQDLECTDFEVVHQHLAARGFRFSGFYEVFRWGPRKAFFGFCNALFVHEKSLS